MTLFLNAHSDRLAPGSFQQPVPIPAAQPGSPDLVQVCFNKDWLPYVLGSLFQLTLNTTWQAASQAELLDGLQKANDLILIFQLAKPGCATIDTGPQGQGGDDMCCCLRMQDGVLQILSCGVWTDVPGWSKSEIAPGQPGTGAPQPPSGGCQIYQGKITPTEPWLIPTPLNAGDTIEISNLIGSWSPTAFTAIWECPDGNLYFAGNCVDGTAGFDAGAPMPSAPLNGTIIFDGTNYYDVSTAANLDTPVTITILPGVTTAQGLVRCNFHGGIDPSGEVTFTAKVCNNTMAAWSHTFDFATTNGGFVAQARNGSAAAGVWTPGTGWTTSDVTEVSAAEFRRIDLHRAFVATNITDVTVIFSLVKGTFTTPASSFGLALGIPNLAGTLEISQQASMLSNGADQTQAGATVVAGATGIDLYLACCDNNIPVFDGSCSISRLIVNGTGVNPFV